MLSCWGSAIDIIVGPLAFPGIVVFGDIQNLYTTVSAGQFITPAPPQSLADQGEHLLPQANSPITQAQ